MSADKYIYMAYFRPKGKLLFICRGYYMPARGYKFYVRVFNSISTSGHVIFSNFLFEAE